MESTTQTRTVLMDLLSGLQVSMPGADVTASRAAGEDVEGLEAEADLVAAGVVTLTMTRKAPATAVEMRRCATQTLLLA